MGLGQDLIKKPTVESRNLHDPRNLTLHLEHAGFLVSTIFHSEFAIWGLGSRV